MEVPADLFADAPVARYWTRAMYYRLLAAELLPRSLDRGLYLDPDILVINPVRALYDTDLEGDLMAAATHTGLLAGITDPVNRLRLENYEAEAYYNSGVLVMDLSAMRREVRPGDIFDYAREHADILLLPDQDVLNGLYGGQILGVFRLSDAVLQGNYDGAARILGDLLKMQTEPIMILAALGSQLRRIYTARMAIDSGKDKYWLMELWEMKSDYPAKLLLSAAKKTTAAWCADAVQMCQVLDRRMKSEKGVDAVGELKLLLVRLGAQRR